MQEQTLKLGRSFSLPLDVVTEATAIVATRGAGKSSASVVIAEEAFAVGVQVVAFDRTGVYWGMRSNAEGTGDGLGIYVLGGPHGDVPLEPSAGRFIADLIVDSGHSFVLDLSDFSKGAAVRFSADLLERLNDRKARHRTTTLLIMDEAHFYAPQTPRGGFKGDAARLMGAMEDVVGLGRSRGLGVVLTTQRTQALNKAVLDLIETLFVMRMLSPRARDAVKGWIQEKHEDDERGVIASLDALPTGTAWIWSPLRGILERHALRRIRTFDSYATPKPGQAAVEPSARVQLDLAALGEQMQQAVERAKADDPAELRKQVAGWKQRAEELAAELEAAQAEREPVRVAVPFVPDEVRMQLGHMADVLRDAADGVALLVAELPSSAPASLLPVADPEDMRLPEDCIAACDWRGKPIHAPGCPHYVARERPRAAAAPPPRVNGSGGGGEGLPRAQRAILGVLAQYGAMSKLRLATQTGYAHSGGGFNNALGALRSAGLIVPGDPIEATPEGLAAVGDVPPLPTGQALLEHWIARPEVGRAHEAVLRRLWVAGPGPKAQVAAATGYEASGGGFNNALGKLRTLGLVSRGEPVCFTPEFAEALGLR